MSTAPVTAPLQPLSPPPSEKVDPYKWLVLAPLEHTGEPLEPLEELQEPQEEVQVPQEVLWVSRSYESNRRSDRRSHRRRHSAGAREHEELLCWSHRNHRRSRRTAGATGATGADVGAAKPAFAQNPPVGVAVESGRTAWAPDAWQESRK